MNADEREASSFYDTFSHQDDSIMDDDKQESPSNVDGIEEEVERKLANEALCERILSARKAIDSETETEDDKNLLTTNTTKQRTVFFL